MNELWLKGTFCLSKWHVHQNSPKKSRLVFCVPEASSVSFHMVNSIPLTQVNRKQVSSQPTNAWLLGDDNLFITKCYLQWYTKGQFSCWQWNVIIFLAGCNRKWPGCRYSPRQLFRKTTDCLLLICSVFMEQTINYFKGRPRIFWYFRLTRQP